MNQQGQAHLPDLRDDVARSVALPLNCFQAKIGAQPKSAPGEEGGLARAGFLTLTSQLRSEPVKHARKWNRFSDVIDAAHPGGTTFYAHPKTGVRNAAVAAQVEIPLERLLR
jgi:hypothetical protein